MADNSVEIDVDLAIKTALKSLDDLNKKFEDFSHSAGEHGGKAESAFSHFEAVLSALGVEKVLEKIWEAAEKLFEVFIVDGIKAASDQEEAINAMNVALINTGHFSVEASDGIIEFAESLEHTTKYSEQQIERNAALIESMAHLSGDGLKKATSAAIELSAAYQIDLDTASRMIGKAAEGNINSFHRLGIQIEKGSSNAETFSNTIRALASTQGTAEAQAQTYAGATAILGNSFEEMQKKTGALVTQNPAIIKGINLLSETFQDFAETIDENSDTLKKWVVDGLFKTLDGLVVFLKGFDYFSRWMQISLNSIAIQMQVFPLYVLEAFNLVFGTIHKFTGLFGGVADFISKATGTLASNIKGSFQNIGTAIAEHGIFDKAADQIAAFTAKFKEAVAEQEQTDDDKTAKDQANSDLRAEAARIEAERKKSFELKAQFEIKQWEDLNATEKLAREKEVLTTISTLMKSKNAELFRIGQAAAISTSIIDGISAVQKAWTLPYPFNIPAVALVATAVAANTAAIAAQPAPAFAMGGIVPGNDYTGDKVMAKVNSGEMVLTMSDQLSLLKDIRGGMGRGGQTVVIQGNVYADNDAQVDSLMTKIKNRLEFGNGTLTPATA